MRTSQSTNKMAANDGRPKLVDNSQCRRFLNVNTGDAIKNFDAVGLKVMRAVPEKHITNFFLPNISPNKS